MAPTRNHHAPSHWFRIGMTDNQRVPRRKHISNDSARWNYRDAYTNGYASETLIAEEEEVYGTTE